MPESLNLNVQMLRDLSDHLVKPEELKAGNWYFAIGKTPREGDITFFYFNCLSNNLYLLERKDIVGVDHPEFEDPNEGGDWTLELDVIKDYGYTFFEISLDELRTAVPEIFI